MKRLLCLRLICLCMMSMYQCWSRIHLVAGIFDNGNNRSRFSVKHFTDTLTRLCENPSCQINRELNGCEFILGFCVQCGIIRDQNTSRCLMLHSDKRPFQVQKDDLFLTLLIGTSCSDVCPCVWCKAQQLSDTDGFS